MEYLLLAIIPLIIVLFFYLKHKKIKKKSSIVKKNEIIKEYELQMTNIFENYSHNSQILKEKKIKFLKKVNQDLSMNIFFDDQEVKTILKNLTNIGNK